MNRWKYAALSAGLILLAGCDVRVGEDEGSAANGNVSAAGKSEDGRLSVSAPGFEMNVAIPESIRAQARMDDDSGIIYPNARFSGIHVEGGQDGAGGRSDGEVELRFSSEDSAETVARWYSDPGRSTHFDVTSNAREGADLVIAGSMKKENGQFRVRLAPRTGGGTDGRVVLTDRN